MLEWFSTSRNWTVMTKSTENIEKKIEAQLEKLKQLKAQKQAIEARERTKKKEQERKG